MFLASKISKKLWKCFQVSRPQRKEERTYEVWWLQLPSSQASWFYIIFKHLFWIVKIGSALNPQWRVLQSASKTGDLIISGDSLAQKRGLVLQENSMSGMWKSMRNPAQATTGFKRTLCNSSETRVKMKWPAVLTLKGRPGTPNLVGIFKHSACLGWFSRKQSLTQVRSPWRLASFKERL